MPSIGTNLNILLISKSPSLTNFPPRTKMHAVANCKIPVVVPNAIPVMSEFLMALLKDTVLIGFKHWFLVEVTRNG